jgi:hypothetical protein
MGADHDLAPGGRIGQRVSDQDADHLLDQTAVRLDRRQIEYGVTGDDQLAAFGQRLPITSIFRDDLVQVYRFQGKFNTVLVQAREQQQVFNHAFEAAGFAGEHL